MRYVQQNERMDDRNSQMHKKRYNLLNLRTIRGVTSLLNKGKQCQASANIGLENSKKATCRKEEYIVINKKDAANDIENIILGNGTKSPVRRKSIHSENTNKHRNDSFGIEDTSNLESSGVERELTLKDRRVNSNEIKSQYQLDHPKHAIHDNMIEKSLNPTSTTFPLGVQK